MPNASSFESWLSDSKKRQLLGFIIRFIHSLEEEDLWLTDHHPSLWECLDFISFFFHLNELAA